MKRILSLVIPLLYVAMTLQAQNPQPLKKIIELKMPKMASDDMAGTRGASVAWHPMQRKYYAVFAGNADYPLAVFDEKGNRLSDDDQTALLDCRGLWYNPMEKTIAGNAYGDYGWFSYKLDKKGMPSDYETETLEMAQPDAQSVGAYNAAGKEVLFVFKSMLYTYNDDGDVSDSVMIHWSRKKSDGPGIDEDADNAPEDYNGTTVIYTGVKGQEVGFLNITNKQIELYDIKTGYLTKSLALPQTATVESSFNFAYANGIYWLFNIELRKWVGYK